MEEEAKDVIYINSLKYCYINKFFSSTFMLKNNIKYNFSTISVKI